MNKIYPNEDYYYCEVARKEGAIVLPNGGIGEEPLRIVRVGPGWLTDSGKRLEMRYKEGDTIMPPTRGMIQIGRGFLVSQRDIPCSIVQEEGDDELKRPDPMRIAKISDEDAKLLMAPEGKA